MSTKLNLTVLAVSKAYNFDIKYSINSEKWIVEGTSEYEPAVKLYWNSKQTEKEFFDELRSFFNQEGKESILPY